MIGATWGDGVLLGTVPANQVNPLVNLQIHDDFCCNISFVHGGSCHEWENLKRTYACIKSNNQRCY